MDTSPEYIKMCEKSGEIQKFWEKPQLGDWFVDEHQSLEGEMIPQPYCGEPLTFDAIWLPRQDQLQNMINLDPFKLHAGFDSFIFNSKGSVDWVQSMEQLWLTYTMKKKFNKVWTGKEWVK